MHNVEKLLKENKLNFDKLEAPEALEDKLRIALKNIKPKNNKILKIKIASIFICLILAAYNFSTLAYYSEKITGYDKVMDANLKKLNELGKGQTINKSFTFKSGLIFTLDGIMVDDNKLITFYTIKNSKGNVENTDIKLEISGNFGSHLFTNSYGTLNDAKTEMKFTANFNPPSIFDNNLTLNVTSKENNETGKISFALDKNKAMGHNIKKFLNKNIETKDTSLHLQYISASPTTTVIKGNIDNILEIALNKIKGITFSPSNLNIKLIADGKVVENQVSELSSNINGVTFKYNFQPLPANFKNLQIEFSSLTSEHIINKNFKLKKELKNANINIENRNIKIDKIYEANGNTYITISTDQDIILTKVNMTIDGKTLPLNNTNKENGNKDSYTRTLEFIGKGSNLELNIQRIIYRTNYNKTIDIISN